jgi:hypothetical protein
MHDAFTRLKIFHAQSTEFLAPDAVIKQRRQNSSIAHPLERVGWGSV